MKNVLVLGGTGFVGTEVCQQLARQRWHVSVATRNRASASHLLQLPQLTVLELDVHDEAALTQAVTGQDAVVNLVAILQGRQADFEHVHVALPQKLARACRAAGVRQLVHISAIGADALQPQAAPSMYLRSKGQGEAVLMQAASSGQGSAFALTILRPSVIFGAGDKFLTVFAELQKKLPFMPLAGADARFQPVWVEDVATAVLRSLHGDGGAPPGAAVRVFEACGPEVFTLRQLVQLSAQLAGIRHGRGRPVLALPDWLGRLQATLMEMLPGEPLMSRDNLDSMRLDNVASGKVPGLEALGIEAAALRPAAQAYLTPR